MHRFTRRYVCAAQLALIAIVSLVAFGGAGGAGAAPTGLVAAYSFDAGTGTNLTDSSGRANTGTISGATWTPGKNGGALSFDGVNDSVRVNDASSLDLTKGMTLEAWVSPSTADSSWRTIVTKETTGNLTYGLFANSDTGRPAGITTIGTQYTQSIVRGSGAVATNTWSHLATTYDGARLRLYVNGTLVATRSVNGSMANSSGALKIGGNAIWPEWFSGRIDDLRVYNRALTASELQSDMATPVAGGTPPPADTQPPTSPGNLSAGGQTQTGLTLTWNASTDDTAVTGYRVFRNGSPAGTIAGTAYTFSGLSCGTMHTLAVEAYDAAGNTSSRPGITASTSPCPAAPADTQAPTAPTGLSTSGLTAAAITLSWSSSTDNVGVTGYGRYQNGVLLSTGAGSSYTFSGLTCGTTYTFAVDATDEAGNRSSKVSTTATTAACTSSSGGSASVYISPAGSDSNGCTQAAPCKSFDRAYRVAAPGGVVEVAAGSYPAQTLNTDTSKTSSSDVVFRPASGASVTLADLTLVGDHIEVRDMRVTTSVSTKTSTDDVTLRNIDMLGFFLEGSSNVSIIGGRVHCGACGYHPQISAEYGVNVAPTNILIDGVLFEDWQSVNTSQHTECLQIGGGNGITIRNSTFRQCATATPAQATASIHISWYGMGPVTKNVLLENNFIYPSGNSFTIQANDFDNLDLKYNSIAGQVVIFNRDGGGTSMDFIGNNMGYTAGGCTAENSGVPINWRYNIMSGGTCGPTDRNAPNGFIDRNTNLHLAAGAAAINAGDPNNYPTTDIDGNARSAAPDAGADER